ncbi:MAG: anhydro-N-acetylmuramic acid kinase, partial [Paracoccaceae bacterium]
MLKQRPVWVLGVTSGRLCEGMHAAMLRTDGVQILELGEVGYRRFDDGERRVLGDAAGDPKAATAATGLLENAAAGFSGAFQGAELIGFGDHALGHDAQGKARVLAGRGEALAKSSGLPVVTNFADNDLQMGGQGGPLSAFFHFACARRIGATGPVAFLNLGANATLSWVDPGQKTAEAPGALMAFDAGPANAGLNDLMMARRGVPMDQDGALAARGKVAHGVLEGLLQTSYFHRMPPKLLRPDDLKSLQAAIRGLSDEDGAATLTAAVAAALVQAQQYLPNPPTRYLVSGGGRHNPVMMAMLRAGLNRPVEPVGAVDLNGDALDALSVAYLAARVLGGLPTTCPATTGVAAPVGGGQISRPAPRV